jgi:hypothetical protein
MENEASTTPGYIRELAAHPLPGVRVWPIDCGPTETNPVAGTVPQYCRWTFYPGDVAAGNPPNSQLAMCLCCVNRSLQHAEPAGVP